MIDQKFEKIGRPMLDDTISRNNNRKILPCGKMMNKTLYIFYQFIINLISTFKSIHKMGRGMGVKKEIDSILMSLQEQPPAVHDLKFKFISQNLYETLNDGTRKVNP